ncbi:hypothetical protein GIB67_022431 [Kingdonia uniflora]|uniref:SURP motif domain-containing protein n=1 Tax=Kingdonia uniflora TaxID=39325 RepID=A0A7J7MTV1_9MAGN|nr:hypothetical protein GIB67_022431 [Kingdonia uniflora]
MSKVKLVVDLETSLSDRESIPDTEDPDPINVDLSKVKLVVDLKTSFSDRESRPDTEDPDVGFEDEDDGETEEEVNEEIVRAPIVKKVEVPVRVQDNLPILWRMDRQAHEYAAMAFAQQQQQAANIQQHQQFGFHPQNRQFPQQVHGTPFLTPHPALQQFPFHRHLQRQHQIHPHPQHLLHLQQQQQQQSTPRFLPHLAPQLVTSPFHNPFESSPTPAVPPLDPELHKVIDKLVEYIAKNGPEFEAMIRDKQQDNPAYSFLFGSEGHSYYLSKLWITTRPSNAPFNPSMMNPSPLSAAGSVAILGAPQLHQPPFPPFYDQQQSQTSQPFMGHGRPDYDPPTNSFKGLSGPLPSDVAVELSSVLNNLTGTKESIKSAKRNEYDYTWGAVFINLMVGDPFLLQTCENIDSLALILQRRANLHDLDNEGLAFKTVLGAVLSRIYHNPHNKEANQSRL